MSTPCSLEDASTGRLARALCPALLLLCLALPALCLAELVHVSPSADADLALSQARQQALERGLAEAVFVEACRLLPAPVPEARLAALRSHLAPRSLDFVQSYQETPRPAPAAPQPAGPAPEQAAGPLVLHLDVEVQRTSLRQTLLRLGFLAGSRHPGVFTLRLGPGVKDKDLLALEPASLLLGLARAPLAVGQAAAPAGRVEVTVERLPQGYYKAVLRQGAFVLASDASDLPGLWLDVWARYFADPAQQPGPGRQRLHFSGFSSPDAVQEFARVLTGWDEAVQDVRLSGLELGGAGVSAEFLCRVVNQEALDRRLREALPGRKLTLVRQEGATAP